MAAVAVNALHAPKARVSPVLHATALPHHAAMARQAKRVLKARATVAVKAAAVVLTTEAKAKAGVRATVLAPKAWPMAVVTDAAVKAVGKSAAATMATNCHATLTP